METLKVWSLLINIFIYVWRRLMAIHEEQFRLMYMQRACAGTYGLLKVQDLVFTTGVCYVVLKLPKPSLRSRAFGDHAPSDTCCLPPQRQVERLVPTVQRPVWVLGEALQQRAP